MQYMSKHKQHNYLYNLCFVKCRYYNFLWTMLPSAVNCNLSNPITCLNPIFFFGPNVYRFRQVSLYVHLGFRPSSMILRQTKCSKIVKCESKIIPKQSWPESPICPFVKIWDKDMLIKSNLLNNLPDLSMIFSLVHPCKWLQIWYIPNGTWPSRFTLARDSTYHFLSLRVTMAILWTEGSTSILVHVPLCNWYVSR